MFNVIKANGQVEPFSEQKLLQSAHRAGVPKQLQDEMVTHIKQTLRENIPTSEIYRQILSYLSKAPDPHIRAKYSLKQAIMDLGPTGYPFEDYVARILEAQGYSTTVRNIMRGKCISHEIDVIAEKNFEKAQKKVMVEAKYHNHLGVKTEVHVAMYTFARFQDVKIQHNFTNALLITNTKATTDAIAYAQCMGMDIISWSYPEGGSLRELVEKYSLHPITTLTSLNTEQQQEFLRRGIVLCRDICKNSDLLSLLRLNQAEREKVYQEALVVCSIEKK